MSSCFTTRLMQGDTQQSPAEAVPAVCSCCFGQSRPFGDLEVYCWSLIGLFCAGPRHGEQTVYSVKDSATDVILYRGSGGDLPVSPHAICSRVWCIGLVILPFVHTCWSLMHVLSQVALACRRVGPAIRHVPMPRAG